MVDSLGQCTIHRLCPGRYVVEGYKSGFRAIQQTIQFSESSVAQALNLELVLHPDTVLLEGVVVQAQNTLGSGSLASRTVAVASLSGADLYRQTSKPLALALATLPGVHALQTGSTVAKPIINGLFGNRVVTVFNGIRLEGQQWGLDHAPEIDTYLADQLTVVKGASGVQYGPEAVGGAILIDLASIDTSQRLGGVINLGFQTNGRAGQSSLRLEGGTPSWGWRVQATGKRGGTVCTPTDYLLSTGFYESDFSATIVKSGKNWRAELFYALFHTRLGVFAGAHIGNITDFNLALEQSRPILRTPFTYELQRPYQLVTHHTAIGKWYYSPSDRTSLRILVSGQYNDRAEFDRHLPLNTVAARANRPSMTFGLQTWQSEALLTTVLPRDWMLATGLHYQFQFNQIGGAYFIPNFLSHTLGVFAQAHKVSGYWLYELGLRADYRFLDAFVNRSSKQLASDRHQPGASVTGGVGRQLSDHWLIKGQLATAWRPPNVNELYSSGLHHGTASIQYGDSTLGSEYAVNAGISVQGRYARWLMTDFQLFYNLISNYIYQAPTLQPVLTVRGVFPAFRFSQALVGLAGANALVKFYPLRWLETVVNTGFVHATNLSTGQGIPFIPPFQTEVKSLYVSQVQNRKIKVVRFGPSVQFVARQTNVDASQDYLPPPPAYLLVGAEAEAEWQLTSRNKLLFGCSGHNLLNTRYRSYLNRLRYFTDELGANYSFFIRLSF
jgi:iron complex outermembrane receptor protein